MDSTTATHTYIRHEGLYRFVQLLTFSGLSGLMAVGVPLLGMAVAIALSRIHGTALYDGLTMWRHTSVATQYDYQNIALWVDTNPFLSNAPLLILWASVGAAVYLSAVQLLRTFMMLVGFEERLHYVHADQSELVWDAILRLSIRLLDAALIYALIFYTLRHLIPQVLATARAVAQYPSWNYAYQAAFAVLGLMVSIWLGVVLLRLFFFRVRLFTVFYR